MRGGQNTSGWGGGGVGGDQNFKKSVNIGNDEKRGINV